MDSPLGGAQPIPIDDPGPVKVVVQLPKDHTRERADDGDDKGDEPGLPTPPVDSRRDRDEGKIEEREFTNVRAQTQQSGCRQKLSGLAGPQTSRRPPQRPTERQQSRNLAHRASAVDDVIRRQRYDQRAEKRREPASRQLLAQCVDADYARAGLRDYAVAERQISLFGRQTSPRVSQLPQDRVVAEEERAAQPQSRWKMLHRVDSVVEPVPIGDERVLQAPGERPREAGQWQPYIKVPFPVV